MQDGTLTHASKLENLAKVRTAKNSSQKGGDSIRVKGEETPLISGVIISGQQCDTKNQGGIGDHNTDNSLLEKGQMGADLDTQMTARRTANWKEEFEHKPLSVVDMSELMRERSPEEVEKIARVLIKFKHVLSDGELNYSA